MKTKQDNKGEKVLAKKAIPNGAKSTQKENKSNKSKVNKSLQNNKKNTEKAAPVPQKTKKNQKKTNVKIQNKKHTGGGRITSEYRKEEYLDQIEEGIRSSKKAAEKIKADNNSKSKKTPEKKVKIAPLGGLGEIGKNMTLFEYGDDIVIIDAGLAFPDEDMPGVDLVIPDFTYLVKNAHKIRGLLITHGHEDHIGAIPYLLSQIDVPVYGTKLSLGIIEGKLDENRPKIEPSLYTVEAGDVINLGVFKAEFIHVNHSIADACAISLRTPAGIIFHSGDFKLDVSPIDGYMMDLTRIGEIGKEGVTLLLCESTNAERSGFTPSERSVGDSLNRIFMQNEGKRLIIATFSSNVHRVQQIINMSAKYGRHVAVIGRSMNNILGAAVELGYMELPDGVLIDVNDIKRYPPGEITLVTTGSQGEPMSALYRIAFAEHDKVKLSPNDVVVLSSSAIPGNEKLVGKIINAIVKNGVKVVHDSVEGVHVSGHACREEIKLLISLLKPKFYMPIHGETRHLAAGKEIAEFMGINPQNIFVSEIGKVLEVDKRSAKFSGEIPSGKVLIDGSGVGDIGNVVLRDRKHLSEDGLVVVVASIDTRDGYVISGPDIVSRGFVYVKESTDLVQKTREVAERAIDRVLKVNSDSMEIKNAIRDDVARFIYKETKRRPMILPIIMDIY